jgi:hypothetical protein
MAIRLANNNDAPHGIPNPLEKCDMAAAPTAAKAYWHNDTWPDTRINNPNDNNKITSTSAWENTTCLVPTHNGNKHNNTTNPPPNITRTRGGA